MDDYLNDTRHDPLVRFSDAEREAARELLRGYTPGMRSGTLRERGRPDRPFSHIDDETWSAMWAIQDAAAEG